MDERFVREAREIGESFAHELVPRIHPNPVDFAMAFETLPDTPAEPRWWTHLDDVAVDAAGAAGGVLRRIGLSPRTVAIAAHGIASDLHRAYRRYRLRESDTLEIVARRGPLPNDRRRGSYAIPIAEVARQVAFVTEIDPERSDRLADWLVFTVAPALPELFNGFKASGEREHVWLVPVSGVPH